MTCLVTARYSMTADIYEQISTQQESGAINRTWNYTNPIKNVKCLAQGILGGGIRVVGSTERWASQYSDVEWVHISMQYKPSKNMRVGNIKNNKGELVWDTIFDILGVTAIPDPFGSITEYTVLAAEAQQI